MVSRDARIYLPIIYLVPASHNFSLFSREPYAPGSVAQVPLCEQESPVTNFVLEIQILSRSPRCLRVRTIRAIYASNIQLSLTVSLAFTPVSVRSQSSSCGSYSVFPSGIGFVGFCLVVTFWMVCSEVNRSCTGVLILLQRVPARQHPPSMDPFEFRPEAVRVPYPPVRQLVVDYLGEVAVLVSLSVRQFTPYLRYHRVLFQRLYAINPFSSLSR